MEAGLVTRVGIAFETVPAAGVHGVGLRALPGNLWRLGRGVVAAREVLRRFRPDVLFLTGGYVGVPLALAGRRIPKVAYVPDIRPALALRLISWLSGAVAVTTEESRAFYGPRKRVVVTGYPVRPELGALSKAAARERLGLGRRSPVVLVFGGSRGARSINTAALDCLPALLQRAQVIHISGTLDWPRVAQASEGLPQTLAANYHPHAYLHAEMGAALAAADLAVSRAGAAVLGEYPLFGLPAVLVPYPHAWRYQKVNADYLVARGAAVLLPDEAIGTQLLPTVIGLLDDPKRLESMGSAARTLAKPGAAERIAAELERLARAKGWAND